MLNAFEKVMNTLTNATTKEDVLTARRLANNAVIKFRTAGALATVRFSQNTADEFYRGEQDYYDAFAPEFDAEYSKYCEAMLKSPFASELRGKEINSMVYESFENAKLAHADDAIEDEKTENALVTRYDELMSNMKFDWQGKQVTLSEIRHELQNSDRELRRAAANALGAGLRANSAELDELFDKLVHTRASIAKKCGVDNFSEIGHARLNRIGYTSKDIDCFRKNVVQYIVPIVAKLKEDIAKTLGVDGIAFYDEDIYLAEGGIKPVVNGAEIFETAQGMYDEISPEVGNLMRKMLADDAFDYMPRSGKVGGAYCESFDGFKQTFILANFTGASGDVDTATHEFGHALAMDAAFYARNFEVGIGGYETAECHSMSMETLTYDYMDRFFGDKARAFCYQHLLTALSFIPYGTMVDEFQYLVYANPDMTPSERNALWLELEGKYRPYLNYEGVEYLEEGTRWQYQSHVYLFPFYYIQYCLAQTVALSFLSESRTKGFADAFERYMTFVNESNYYPFSELVKRAGLPYPFADGTLSEVAANVLKVANELK